MARKNPTPPEKASARSTSEARSDLAARAAHNADGATLCRSDPLADAQAARAVVQAVEEHAAELTDAAPLPMPVSSLAREAASSAFWAERASRRRRVCAPRIPSGPSLVEITTVTPLTT